MKITEIKQQVKRQNRYSVFVDGKYSFSLSENELLNTGLRIGQEFDKDEFEKLQRTATEDKAYMRALDMLARRPRSEWEMREYLKRKDHDQHTIEKTLNMLSNRGYIDDAKFALAWVENRRLLKKTSKRRLMLELQQKRVSSDDISLALEQDETDEREVLKELIVNKRTQSRYQDDQKLLAYLMRQGFSYGDIKSMLAEASAD